MEQATNRRIVLATRPVGEPQETDFKLETGPIPEPGSGELLARNLYVSVDPYMRGRLRDEKSYAKPLQVGEVMIGGSIAQVVKSNVEGYAAGDLVAVPGGWQDYVVIPGETSGPFGLYPIERDAGLPLSAHIGVTGMPGITAYLGMTKLGKPQAGETLVVSAAAGAVGSVVGQIGKIHGCRVIGIAGGATKCRHCVEDLGFDVCLDYKAEPDLAAALRAACPDGVDIYFENVGGAVLDAVVPLLNRGARVPICGFVSQYNEAGRMALPWEVLSKLDPPPEHRFFLVWEWPDEFQSARHQLLQWIQAGRLRYRDDVVSGFEQIPRAFIGMLRGENLGKRSVHIADPE